jgi:hypothetical protein
MFKIATASLTCLALGASAAAVAGGPAKAAASDVAQAFAPPPASSSARYRCQYRDRTGHTHYRWCSPPGGASVTEPPPPIPSPHYYWRG